MITAGESSGDILGADLMRALRKRYPQCRISGVGGPLMQAQGMELIFPMQDIAVMGVRAVLANLRFLLGRIALATDYALHEQPDIVITIDAPDFSHRLAKRIKRKSRNIKTICYVAPSVWMWRAGRAQKMRRLYDHVLALLPFEPDIFQKLDGPPCSYIGHTAITHIPAPQAGSVFRKKYKISEDTKILCILPGSRKGELKALRAPFHDALMRMDLEGTRLAVPVVPHLRAEIERISAAWPYQPLLVEQTEKADLFAASDVALAASGTVALELGLAGIPMVIGYKTDMLLGAIIMRIAGVPSVVLPNIVLDRPAVKEFLQERCTGENFAAALSELLTNEAVYAQAKADLADFKARMVQNITSPSDEAVRIIHHFIAT